MSVRINPSLLCHFSWSSLSNRSRVWSSPSPLLLQSTPADTGESPTPRPSIPQIKQALWAPESQTSAPPAPPSSFLLGKAELSCPCSSAAATSKLTLLWISWGFCPLPPCEQNKALNKLLAGLPVALVLLSASLEIRDGKDQAGHPVPPLATVFLQSFFHSSWSAS